MLSRGAASQPHPRVALWPVSRAELSMYDDTVENCCVLCCSFMFTSNRTRLLRHTANSHIRSLDTGAPWTLPLPQGATGMINNGNTCTVLVPVPVLFIIPVPLVPVVSVHMSHTHRHYCGTTVDIGTQPSPKKRNPVRKTSKKSPGPHDKATSSPRVRGKGL